MMNIVLSLNLMIILMHQLECNNGGAMKNNKGFSILELIVSFSLTMIIVVILFEIIVSMKEIYEKSVTKTELINRQNLFTDYLYNDKLNNNLIGIGVCGNNCISFSFQDGQIKNWTWDTQFGVMAYDSYTTNLLKNAQFDTSLSLTDSDNNTLTGAKICYNQSYGLGGVDSFVSIKLPILNPLFPDEDFGINLFYTFDSNNFSLNLPISSDC